MRGLFAGGTLCSEAQIVALGLGLAVASNVPVPGAAIAPPRDGKRSQLIDLGDDAFTRGRPHPMIEPAVRDEPLRRRSPIRSVGVVLLDVVLGTGGHGIRRAISRATGKRARANGPHVIASVTGTDGDVQGLDGADREAWRGRRRRRAEQCGRGTAGLRVGGGRGAQCGRWP